MLVGRDPWYVQVQIIALIVLTTLQRAQWASYFDDVNAIIFLAPINCFDERLAEDRTVNRLDDSVHLWKLVCANKLLARTELVLFLNKCDLLAKKLKSGVRFKDYVRDYGEQDNEATSVAKCASISYIWFPGNLR